MPEWLFSGLIAFLAGAIGTVGVVVGHLVTARAQRRAVEVEAEDKLTDQLQEELSRYRAAADARATAAEERMNRLDRLVDGYRTHAHELRSHIWDEKPPPPPAWPVDLPK